MHYKSGCKRKWVITKQDVEESGLSQNKTRRRMYSSKTGCTREWVVTKQDAKRVGCPKAGCSRDWVATNYHEPYIKLSQNRMHKRVGCHKKNVQETGLSQSRIHKKGDCHKICRMHKRVSHKTGCRIEWVVTKQDSQESGLSRKQNAQEREVDCHKTGWIRRERVCHKKGCTRVFVTEKDAQESGLSQGRHTREWVVTKQDAKESVLLSQSRIHKRVSCHKKRSTRLSQIKMQKRVCCQAGSREWVVTKQGAQESELSQKRMHNRLGCPKRG